MFSQECFSKMATTSLVFSFLVLGGCQGAVDGVAGVRPGSQANNGVPGVATDPNAPAVPATGDPGTAPAGPTTGAGAASATSNPAVSGASGGTGVAADDPATTPQIGDATAELCASFNGELRVGRTRLRRMTRAQFNNTVRDLIGETGDPASAISPDEKLGPFHSNAIAPITDLLVQQHAEVAASLAASAAPRMGTLSSCDLAADATDACATQFIQEFGLRAYRRPLAADEVSSYLTVYNAGRADATAQDGFQLLLETMLQSPFFLYHVNVGPSLTTSDTPTLLSSYELASRLSYFLWNTMPDEALFTAAADGSLEDPGVLATQVDRMLADARAADAIPLFHRQWLGIGDMSEVVKDTALFPQFNQELVDAMLAETGRFADYVIRQGDGLLSTLFTADFTLPDAPLFDIYGITQPAGFTVGQTVSLNPAERSGLLTQPAFLATHAHQDQTSPVHRGIAVRENILCQPLDPPPANVNNVAPAVSTVTTTRERFEAHSNDPVCAGCHTLIDPIGLGFENYDTIGRYRTMENNQMVDATGEMLSVMDDLAGPFTGAVELSHKLATSREVADCVANQWFRFALGRIEAADDACSLQGIHDGFEASGGNVREMLKSIALSDAFKYVLTGI